MKPALLLRVLTAISTVSLLGCDEAVERSAEGRLQVQAGNTCPSAAEAKELLRSYPFSYQDGKSRCGGGGCRFEELVAVNGEGTTGDATVTCCYEVQSPCAPPDGVDGDGYRERVREAGCVSGGSTCQPPREAVQRLSPALERLGCQLPLVLAQPVPRRFQTCVYPVTATFDCSDDSGFLGCGRPLLQGEVPRLASLVAGDGGSAGRGWS